MVLEIKVRGLKEVRGFLKRLDKENEKLAVSYSRDLAKNMKRYAVTNLKGSGHTYTGRTAASIRRRTAKGQSKVYFDNPEAEFVGLLLEKGVREHKVSINSISPVSGQSVGDWFVSKANGPFGNTATVSIAPTKFWSRAIRMTKTDAKKLIQKYARRIR